MSNFLADGTNVLPAVKTDARSPTGATTEIDASDINDLRQALIDLRAAVINDWTGSTTPTVTGSPAGNAALISLLQALQDVGVIRNGTPNQGQREAISLSDAYYVARG